MYDNPEVDRLKMRWESASQNASFRNKETAQATAEIAKEKTLYFEKLALGSGATIAALVSFLGAHASRLQPAWLLRSALVTLACSMTCSMLRNWLYPFYIFSAKLVIEFKAKQDEGRRKKDFLEVVPAIASEDGHLIDMNTWLLQHEKEDAEYGDLISQQRRAEERYWNWTVRVENGALVLALLSGLLLVLLAWRNF